MYELQSFETILDRMMAAALRAAPGTDNREGSLLYTALAAAAAEVQECYIALDGVLRQSFADTQSRDFLLRRAAERGVAPRESKAALWGAACPTAVSAGMRYLGDRRYYIVEKWENERAYLRCETLGTAGNGDAGTVCAVSYAAVSSLVLSELVEPGEDEEATELFRSRFLTGMRHQPFGGNIADYHGKALALDGVGFVKVTPAWSGGGTVLVTLQNPDGMAVPAALVGYAQNCFDPVVNTGKGLGLAPIGHQVTVKSVAEKTVNAVIEVRKADSVSENEIRTRAKAALDSYMADCRKQWAGQDALRLWCSRLIPYLYGYDGFVNVAVKSLSGSTEELLLGAGEVPVSGTMTVNFI